ncbi:MAG: hypothetical protein WEC37_00040 [Anaerolineales bacterium]
MAQKSSFSTENLLYVCILIVALALRFFALGSPLLTEHEASSALPAYQLNSGQTPDLGDHPAYVVLTSLLFALLPSNEFLARFWPALFGTAFVLLPYFWRDTLGRKPALLLGLALAIDPGAVAISRLASGHMLAVSASLFALTAWRHNQPFLAGILGALALLAAPTLYFGTLAILLAAFLSTSRPPKTQKAEFRVAVIAAAATLLVGGTLFGSVPQGLGGVGNVFSTFLQGWRVPSWIFMRDILFALVGYGLPALIFGSIAAIRAWTQNLAFSKTLSLAALFALVLILVYPGRQVADLLWVLLPLWALAAAEISRYLQIPEQERAAAFGTLALVLLLVVFFTLTLARLSFSEAGTELYRNYLLVAGAVIVLGGLVTTLIAFGWSRQAASNGLVWGLSILFVIALFAASTRFARPGVSLANELWSPGPAAGQGAVLLANLDSLSAIDQGQPQGLPVTSRLESNALAWILRAWPAPSLDQLNVGPDLFITLATGSLPEEASTYRGQSFALSVQRAWDGAPPNVFSWLLFRQAPTLKQEAILWAQIGIFPNGLLFLQGQQSLDESVE